MAKPLTVEDILPLAKHLPLSERARLTRLLVGMPDSDAATYRAIPARPDEFSSDVDVLNWDADGW